MPGRGDFEKFVDSVAHMSSYAVEEAGPNLSDEEKAAIRKGVFDIAAAYVVPGYIIDQDYK